MNQAERKEKVAYLWKQTRRFFWQQVIIQKIISSQNSEIKPSPIETDEYLDDFQ